VQTSPVVSKFDDVMRTRGHYLSPSPKMSSLVVTQSGDGVFTVTLGDNEYDAQEQREQKEQQLLSVSLH
jgi:hypothetical protein